MRITRRELAVLLAGAPAVAPAAAAPSQAAPAPPEGAARVGRDAAVVRNLDVPFDTEPATVFRAR
jgi:hypothetical protein